MPGGLETFTSVLTFDNLIKASRTRRYKAYSHPSSILLFPCHAGGVETTKMSTINLYSVSVLNCLFDIFFYLKIKIASKSKHKTVKYFFLLDYIRTCFSTPSGKLSSQV